MRAHARATPRPVDETLSCSHNGDVRPASFLVRLQAVGSDGVAVSSATKNLTLAEDPVREPRSPWSCRGKGGRFRPPDDGLMSPVAFASPVDCRPDRILGILPRLPLNADGPPIRFGGPRCTS